MFRIPSGLDPIGASPLIEAQTLSYLVRERSILIGEANYPFMQIAHGSSVLISPPPRRPAMFYATMQRMANAISIHSYQRSRLWDRTVHS